MRISSFLHSLMAVGCVLAGPGLAAAAPTPENSAEVALSALQSVCLGGDTAPGAVLARADQAGWRKAKPAEVDTWDLGRDRSLRVGATVLILDVWSLETPPGREDSCTIGARAPTTGWRDAAQHWLGFAPSLVLGPATTFFAFRTDDGWRAATAKDRDDGGVSRGRHYNFVASDGVWRGDDRPAALLTVDHFR